MKTLLELFLVFMKIGFCSFGGLSMIPIINEEMVSHGWMSISEVSDIIAIAEMTPGPLGINSATFAGMRTAGPAGAAAANLGVMVPSLTLCLLAAVFIARLKGNPLLERTMFGIRPVCIGMMLGTCATLYTNYLTPVGVVSLGSVVIGLVAIVLLAKYKFSVPKIILLSAALGLLLT